MPELPEVETISRDLDHEIKGLIFKDVQVLDSRVVRGLAPAEFAGKLVGRRILHVGRRGKAILIDLGNYIFIVQPMMTGQLIVMPSRVAGAPSKATRVVFRLSKNKTLVYNDQRLFGRLSVVRDVHENRHIRALGPEPLGADFTADVLQKQIEGRRSAIKVVLLDGTCVAGIGNIYASEILFGAGISPMQRASDLATEDVLRLWKSMRTVLAEAVRLRGTSMQNYRDGRGEEGRYLKVVKVYGRDGKPCRVCGNIVQRIVQAQRSTFFCPKCQT